MTFTRLLTVAGLSAAALCLAIQVDADVSQASPKLAKPGKIIAKFKRASGSSNNAVAGPNHGGSCATPNRTTSRTSHRAQPVECTVGGVAATCTCDLSCDFVCENYAATETCTPSNCTVSMPSGGSSSGVNTVEPAF